MLQLQQLLKNEGSRLVCAIPRGHGKSTLVSFLFPLWCVLYKKSPFILIVSATEEIATPFLDMIKDEIQYNETVIQDFGKLKGDRWNVNEVWLKNDTCIMVRGIDGSIRGVRYKHLRPTLVLCDDLLKDSVVESDSKREKISKTFKEALLNAGDTFSNFLVVGTVLHEDDLMSELLSEETTGWKKIRKQGIISWAKAQDLWEQWEKLYTNLNDPDREKTALDFFIANKKQMLEGAKTLWPEKWSYYDLMKKKIDDGEIAFSKEIMNNPKNSQEYIFQKLHYWEKLPSFDDMEIVMAVDPSLAKSKTSDYSAIVTLGRHRQTGQMYVIDGDIRRIKPHKLIELISQKLELYPVDRLGVETVQFQHLLFEDLKKYLLKKKQYINIVPIKTTSNKHSRIVALENSITNGYILFNKDNRNFNNQVKDYNIKAKHDDAPDALALAVSLLDTYKSIETAPSDLLF